MCGKWKVRDIDGSCQNIICSIYVEKWVGFASYKSLRLRNLLRVMRVRSDELILKVVKGYRCIIWSVWYWIVDLNTMYGVYLVGTCMSWTKSRWPGAEFQECLWLIEIAKPCCIKLLITHICLCDELVLIVVKAFCWGIFWELELGVMNWFWKL